MAVLLDLFSANLCQFGLSQLSEENKWKVRKYYLSVFTVENPDASWFTWLGAVGGKYDEMSR